MLVLALQSTTNLGSEGYFDVRWGALGDDRHQLDGRLVVQLTAPFERLVSQVAEEVFAHGMLDRRSLSPEVLMSHVREAYAGRNTPFEPKRVRRELA